MLYRNNDTMAVSAMEQAHYGDYPDAEVKYSKCPICGESTHYGDFEGLFIDENDEIVGCNNCMRMIDRYGQDMKVRGSYI